MRAIVPAVTAAFVLVQGSAQAASPQHPAVLELFTSQGCSSCPPANAILLAVANRPDVLALSFGVTYWDYLGWKDVFAKPEFTQRQRTYERRLGHASPFTPQLVVDGTRDVVGSTRSEVDALIASSNRADTPALMLTAESVSVGEGAKDSSVDSGADIWLVRYDPRVQQIPVARGENAGVTLPHRNVVRSLTRLGEWRGKAVRFALPPPEPGLKTAVLLQASRGGAILSAARD